MASQEFLASFAVDIDEGGVSRLQAVLAENRELAESLASAFGDASAAIRSFAEELGALPGFSAGGIVTEGLSAPVNIHIHASGVSAQDIGESLYDTAERYLLRTLRSAFPL